jgi:hypothetical protein
MATQLKNTDFAYTPAPTSRPNIRVAFIAGEATAAVNDAMAKMPADTRDGTLEDLVQEQANAPALTWDQAVTALASAIAARDEFDSTVLKPRNEIAEATQIRGEDVTAILDEYEKLEAQYGELVMAVVNATCALGLVPAPGAIELAYKVHALADDEFHLNEGKVNRLVAALDRDAQAILATEKPDDVELIQSMTCALIEKAQELLSPRMYSAFLRWGEAASNLSTLFKTDEDGAQRCRRTAAAGRALGETSAEHVHDVIIKTLVVGLEAADCSAFGPFANVQPNGELGCEETLLRGLSADLDWVSPLPALFNELSVTAWELSNAKSAFSVPIGSAISKAFSFARGLDSAEREIREIPTDLPAAYDRFMGGPLIQWRKAYAKYEDARDAFQAYDRDVHTPTFANPDVADSVAEQVQEQFDVLLMARHDAVRWLYRIPAPSASELAIKLKIFDESDGHELTYAPEVIRQITIDARRFGRHGANLQTDIALLEAFETRRKQFEATQGRDLSAYEETAYFGRIDAADMVLLNDRATTVEAVLAKLRVAFMHQIGEDWSDLAISNTKHSRFTEGLALSDMYTRMAWSAIEDLARIAGVSLAEQGA